MESKKKAIVLGIIPWIAYVVISPFLNVPKPLIAGVPPLMFWNLLWIVLTTVCLLIAYKIEFGGK